MIVSWAILAFSCLALADEQSDQMANVQAIMARSAQFQAQQQAAALQDQQAQKASAGFFQSLFKGMNSSPKQQMSSQDQVIATSVPFSSSSDPATAVPDVTNVQSKIADLKQSNGLFQDETNQRLDALDQTQAALQTKVAQLAEALSMINEQQVQLAQQVQMVSKQLTPSSVAGAEKSAAETSSVLNTLQEGGHNKTTEYVLYVILLLLVIIILLMLMPRRSAYRLETVASRSETIATDYDVMSSEEGVSTKLDLARAYIAMEDYHAAARLLAEIKKMGNKQQCMDAEKLYNGMPVKE